MNPRTPSEVHGVSKNRSSIEPAVLNALNPYDFLFIGWNRNAAEKLIRAVDRDSCTASRRESCHVGSGACPIRQDAGLQTNRPVVSRSACCEFSGWGREAAHKLALSLKEDACAS